MIFFHIISDLGIVKYLKKNCCKIMDMKFAGLDQSAYKNGNKSS